MKTELRPAIIPKEEIEAHLKKLNEPRKPPQYGKETTLPVEQILLPYGVGIDTHKKFIQICVLRKDGDELRSSEREMRTRWKTLAKAADWINEKLGQKPGDTFNYTIESTGCYHIAIARAAIPVLSRPKEPFGEWGASIAGRHKKGGFMKARNAIARRIATSLWWVHMKGEEFSYEKYKLNEQQPVPIITLKEMGLDRYKTILAAFQIYNSEQVIRAWMKGKLKDIPGFGDVAFATVQGWYERNKGKQTETTNDEDNEEFKRAASLSVPERRKRSAG